MGYLDFEGRMLRFIHAFDNFAKTQDCQPHHESLVLISTTFLYFKS